MMHNYTFAAFTIHAGLESPCFQSIEIIKGIINMAVAKGSACNVCMHESNANVGQAQLSSLTQIAAMKHS